MKRLRHESLHEFGTVYCPRDSRTELEDLFEEIDDYFDAGVTLRAGDTVFDVGANIGAFAIVAARRCDGDLDIHCFEPAPVPFSALRQNTQENPWLRQARHHLHNLALAAEADIDKIAHLYYFSRYPSDSTLDIEQKRREFTQFFAFHGDRIGRIVEDHLGSRAVGGYIRSRFGEWPKSGWGIWLANRISGMERVTCTQDAMSRVVARHGVSKIDLLKVDVEGFEIRVLEGIDPETWTRIRQVAVETDGRDSQTGKLVRILRDAGFDDTRVTPTKAAKDRGLDNLIVTALRS